MNTRVDDHTLVARHMVAARRNLFSVQQNGFARPAQDDPVHQALARTV